MFTFQETTSLVYLGVKKKYTTRAVCLKDVMKEFTEEITRQKATNTLARSEQS